MNWYSIFYWLTVADNAKAFFVVFIIIFTAISVISTICYIANSMDHDPDNQKMSRKWMWWSIPFMAIFWSLYIFTPSKEDSLVIICGGAVGEFVTNDTSSAQIPADLTRYLHLSFQKEISDLDAETKQDLGISTPKDDLTVKLQDLTKEQIIEYLQNDTTIQVLK